MNLRADRILDRLWLALSGAAALTVALQWGAQLGLRTGSAGAAFLAAEAAAPDRSGTAASQTCANRPTRRNPAALRP